MTVWVYVHRESPVKIWGLTTGRRVERVVANAGVGRRITDLGAVGDGDRVLILRGDYLFDDRLVIHLAGTPDTVLWLETEGGRRAVGANVPGADAVAALAVIDGAGGAQSLPGVGNLTLEALSISFQERIRKFEPPFVVPVGAEDAGRLEKRLFDWSYKGVTDLVTKWAWPLPARWVVKGCVRWGLRPNQVTSAGLLLVIAAGALFAGGQFGWGLLAGWLMTFLDTVDGKLARVTVTSSRFGHYFDHVIDIVHPPIWYVLWGVGLRSAHPGGWGFPAEAVYALILAGYVAGRLAEGSFQWFLGRFGIFCWEPLDSCFRLVTARRNPCLLLLTAGFFAGRPDLGLLAVAAWTVVTSAFLFVRLFQAASRRIRTGPLESWLKAVDAHRETHPRAVRWFTRPAAKP